MKKIAGYGIMIAFWAGLFALYAKEHGAAETALAFLIAAAVCAALTIAVKWIVYP